MLITHNHAPTSPKLRSTLTNHIQFWNSSCPFCKRHQARKWPWLQNTCTNFIAQNHPSPFSSSLLTSQKQRAQTRVAEHSVIAVVRHGGRTASALQAHVVPRSNPSPWSPSPFSSNQVLESSTASEVPSLTPRSLSHAHRPILAHSASLAVHSSQRLQRGKIELRSLWKDCVVVITNAFGTFRPFCIFVNPPSMGACTEYDPTLLASPKRWNNWCCFSPWSTFFKFLSAHQLVSSHTSPEGRPTH